MLSDIVILAILVLVNGFFSSAELAILSVNQTKLKYRADRGDKKAILIKKTLAHEDIFLSTIQIAISFVGLFSGAYAGQTFADPVVNMLLGLGVSIPITTLKPIVVFIITIVLLYFNLVLGELVPKRLALKKADAVANVVVKPVNILSVVFTPFVKLISVSSNAIVRLLGIDPNEEADQITEEEIRMMVDAGSEIGNIDENEMEMINNIFEFDDKTAEDIATHRTDIIAIDIDDDFNVILPELLEMKYSRVPVYEDNIDNIIGILHVKDLIKHFFDKKIHLMDDTNFDIRPILRKSYFVPTSKKLDELFTEMKKNKVHIAIVIDEYGGIVGLVTMEDLIEEVMGDILDEYDDEEYPEIKKIDDNTFEIVGTTSLEDVEDELDTELPDEDYDTISGFLIGQIGYIPSDDEKLTIEFSNYSYEVVMVEDKRIAKIIATKINS